MDQLSGVQTEKISSTLEELDLDRRAYHLLKRASIHYVSGIISRGESGILNIRGMGVVTANHIISVVAKHLNIPENEVFSEKTIQIAFISYKDKDFDPLDCQVSVLGLTSSTLKALNSIGVVKVYDLLKLKAESVINYDKAGLRIIEIRKIYTLLDTYLSRYSLDNMQLKNFTLKQSTSTITDLKVVLNILFKNERALLIIKKLSQKVF